ncbi:MAG TPA: hypothetical protein IAA51_03095 [Candidatus Cottocaccamicrobium excrementipullorum]|nr:hypothetical protein [Candidatus Cottocaccamicrobium excrementipullorum]
MKKERRITGKKRKLFMGTMVAAIICTAVCLVQCVMAGSSAALWIDGLRLDILICEILLLAEGYGLLAAIILYYRDEKKNVVYGSR